MEYEFTLKFKLPVGEADIDAVVERLGEQGCTDALVGLGQAGYIGLDFVREAQNAEAALLSAMDDVKRAVPGAVLVEAGPDFVGLTDVADVVGQSRQNMRKLMLSNSNQFPSPVHSGSASVWHLAHVLEFMQERNYKFSSSVLDVARTTMQINLVKEQPFIDARFAASLQQRLHA
ncbi:MAG: DNA-binding protein [Gammaproteobacteria bacterium]|jgi:predicted DNA-binding transcriptional regulator AlpA|nr:DNA-binding protein [Gammaproteobacteria bacterium]